jgi:hypothetical protein
LGSFVLKLTGASKTKDLFAEMFQTRINELHPFFWGEADQRGATDAFFQCLVIFQKRGGKSVRMRVMMVRAGRQAECLDMCYSHVADVLSVEPAFLRVAVRETKELHVPIISV